MRPTEPYYTCHTRTEFFHHTYKTKQDKTLAYTVMFPHSYQRFRVRDTQGIVLLSSKPCALSRCDIPG